MALTHRFRWKDGYRTASLTPLRALRNRCMDCCNWSTQEVKLCPAEDCAAWPFRLGRDPSKGGHGNKAHFKKATAATAHSAKATLH